MFTTNFLNSLGFPDSFVFLLITGLILSIIYLSFKSSKNVNFPPGPVGLPLIGYLPFLDSEQPFKTLDKLAKKYGDVFSIPLAPFTRIVVLNSWNGAKEALGNSALNDRPHGVFDVIPNGLGFASENDVKWSEQRRFCVRAMKDVGLGESRWKDFIQNEVEEVIEGLTKTRGQPVDFVSALEFTFTSNMMTLLFDRRPDDATVQFTSERVDLVMRSIPALSPVPFLPPFVNGLLKTLGMAKKLKPLEEFSEILECCIEKRLQDAEEGEESFVKKYQKRIQSDEKSGKNVIFTNKSLRGNVQSLVLGGSETSRTALSWLLLAMSEHQQVQAKVHLDLESAPGAGSSWEDKRRIPYTCAAISEVLRWRTIAPINNMRSASEDMKIQGYDIPRDTVVVVNSWAVHNDPAYWPDPDQFRPERFLDEDGQYLQIRPDSYMPFSFGQRGCPGEMLARMEIINYFSNIMRKFTVLPAEGSTKPGTILGLTYQPTDVWLRFEPRSI